jgi:hypothetical protein
MMRTKLSAPRALTILVACIMMAGAAQARTFTWTPLPPEDVAAMSPEGRALYQEGLRHLDRINYRAAMESLNQAVEQAPDSIHLRYLAVTLARYMGDNTYASRLIAMDSAPTSVQYYDMAIQHLRALAESPRLNAREKQRAAQSLEDVTALRTSVTERDERRKAWGEAFTKAYARIAFERPPEEMEKERQEREREAARSQGQFVLPTADMRQPPLNLAGPTGEAGATTTPGLEIPAGQLAVPNIPPVRTPEAGTLTTPTLNMTAPPVTPRTESETAITTGTGVLRPITTVGDAATTGTQ